MEEGGGGWCGFLGGARRLAMFMAEPWDTNSSEMREI